jgi:signal transduction histidine kinase
MTPGTKPISPAPAPDAEAPAPQTPRAAQPAKPAQPAPIQPAATQPAQPAAVPPRPAPVQERLEPAAPPPRPAPEWRPPERPQPGPSERAESPTEEINRLATALKTVQRQHRASRRRFHDFILAASDWVWEADERATITFISERITEIIGRPATALVGHSLYELGAEVGRNGPNLREAIAGRRPFRGIAIEMTDAEGARRYCRLSGVPAFEEQSGRFIGYRGAGIDATTQFEAQTATTRSRAKLERQLDEARSQADNLRRALSSAEAAVHAKSEFLASVSHELRTPLNAIIGFSEIMEQEMYGALGNERYKDYAASVVDSARHLLAIIDDLLDMAKLEAGKLDLAEGTLDVAKLVDNCLALLGNRFREHGLTLTVRLPKDGPLLWADERLVKQMLTNLLTNAIKFTPEGGTVTLEVKADAETGYAFTVRDTGIGIAQEDIEKVLAPFGQVESTISRSHAGTGLGLPLVDAMIRLHGGALDLKSAVGEGTAVTLIFPPERIVERPANAQH